MEGVVETEQNKSNIYPETHLGHHLGPTLGVAVETAADEVFDRLKRKYEEDNVSQHPGCE